MSLLDTHSFSYIDFKKTYGRAICVNFKPLMFFAFSNLAAISRVPAFNNCTRALPHILMQWDVWWACLHADCVALWLIPMASYLVCVCGESCKYHRGRHKHTITHTHKLARARECCKTHNCEWINWPRNKWRKRVQRLTIYLGKIIRIIHRAEIIPLWTFMTACVYGVPFYTLAALKLGN